MSKRSLTDMPEASITPSHVQSDGPIGQPRTHDSAVQHVSGKARYIDDIPALQNQLHAYVGQSSVAHGTITAMDLTRVRNAEGVVDVISAADVPGQLDIGPVFPGDPMLVESEVNHYGQAVFAVLASSYQAARKAAQLADIRYTEAPLCWIPTTHWHNSCLCAPPIICSGRCRSGATKRSALCARSARHRRPGTFLP